MSKSPPDDIGAFVDAHPTTAVLELLGLMSAPTHPTTLDRDVLGAYLQRVAECDGLPEPLRLIARQLQQEWDIESVSSSAAAAMLSLGGLLH